MQVCSDLYCFQIYRSSNSNRHVVEQVNRRFVPIVYLLRLNQFVTLNSNGWQELNLRLVIWRFFTGITTWFSVVLTLFALLFVEAQRMATQSSSDFSPSGLISGSEPTSLASTLSTLSEARKFVCTILKMSSSCWTAAICSCLSTIVMQFGSKAALEEA